MKNIKKLFNSIIILFFLLSLNLIKPKIIFSQVPILIVHCGTIYNKLTTPLTTCDCVHEEPINEIAQTKIRPQNLAFIKNILIVKASVTDGRWCCGWVSNNVCNAVGPPTPTATPRVDIPAMSKELLDSLNPLKLYSSKADQLSTPGGIITEILKFAFPLAGIILFIMLTMAGFKMLAGASNSKNMEEGKQMISTAIAGFIILFASYWIIQIIEIVFGINILGN